MQVESKQATLLELPFPVILYGSWSDALAYAFNSQNHDLYDLLCDYSEVKYSDHVSDLKLQAYRFLRSELIINS